MQLHLNSILKRLLKNWSVSIQAYGWPHHTRTRFFQHFFPLFIGQRCFDKSFVLKMLQLLLHVLVKFHLITNSVLSFNVSSDFHSLNTSRTCSLARPRSSSAFRRMCSASSCIFHTCKYLSWQPYWPRKRPSPAPFLFV